MRWLGLLLWTIVTSLLAGHVVAAVLTEYEAKAAFLYHFGSFVAWPPALSDGRDTPFIIGVLGVDPFGSVLDGIVEGKTIRAQPVVVKRFRRAEEAMSSHILFISTSEEERLSSIFEVLKGTRVLTVSELERFIERGGMIALRMVDRKVHFDINVEATARGGLKMSSQLLKLARVVHGTVSARE